ncbi:MAG: hypothetical protein COB04_12845 [Gammaproteobacteria bacterium]|nr:MAG: hypothetical protein COB04_12845 [Gammaproteobacteria bacterium]
MDLLLYILAGAGVGFAIGLTGVGGGSLMTPLLLMFGFPPHTAIGTDLLYASITKSSGVWLHRRQGTIRWRIMLTLLAGSLPTSAVTIYILHQYFRDSTGYADILTTALGVMLLITATVLAFKKKIQSKELSNQVAWITNMQTQASKWTFFMGLILGVLVTLSSVGAGAFGTAVLMILYPRLPSIHIIGTDLAHAVPLTLVAGMGHLFLGHVDFGLLGALIIGSLPAIYVGTKLGAKLPENILQPVLACTLFVLGAKFAFF